MALAKGLAFYMNGVPLSCALQSFDATAETEALDATTLCNTARTYALGLKTGTVSASGIWDADTANEDKIHDVFQLAYTDATDNVVTATLQSLAFDADAVMFNATQTSYSGRGKHRSADNRLGGLSDAVGRELRQGHLLRGRGRCHGRRNDQGLRRILDGWRIVPSPHIESRRGHGHGQASAFDRRLDLDGCRDADGDKRCLSGSFIRGAERHDAQQICPSAMHGGQRRDQFRGGGCPTINTN